MSAEQILKVGLIGLGRMGQNHLRILSMLKGVSLEFVYDADAQLARRLAAERGTRAVDNLSPALRDVEAVVICTPTITHADYFEQAAETVPNIFVEKPLADTLETSIRLQELAEERGLNVGVGFIERFNPAVEQMRTLLERSEKVVSIDFVRTNKISSRITDVDVVTDLMIHDIDLALHLNGPVKSVSAHGAISDGMIGYAAALLSHSNGRFSRVQASRITDKKMRSIQATCTDMFIDCELLRKEIVLSRQSEVRQNEGEPYVISARSDLIEVRPQEALLTELQVFIGSCRGEVSDIAPGVRAAVDAMRVCDQIQRAIMSEAAGETRQKASPSPA